MGLVDWYYSKYEKSEEGIIVYKTDGRINFINKKCLEIFKYPQGVKPKTIFDLMEDSIVEIHKHRIKKTLGMNNKNIEGVCYTKERVLLDIIIVSKNVILIKKSTSLSFENFKDFFEETTTGMFITDKRDKIIHCNKYFLEVLGYKKQDIIYKKMTKYTAWDTDQQNCMKFLKNDGTYLILFYKMTIHKEKKYYLLENLSKNDVFEENKKKDELLYELEVLTQTGYWEWCIETNELFWSDGLKDIYEIDEISYEKYLECNHPEDSEMILKNIENCVKNGEKYTMVHRLVKNKSKKQVWLRATGKLIKSRGMSYIIGVAQDITEQYFIQEDYKRQKDLAELNSKAKTAFVSSVSHELRTPLNGIIGMISLLKSTDLVDNQKKYISVLDNSCGVLLSIINNILDFSKIESGKLSLDFRSFDVRQCVENIVFLFKPSALIKNVKLEYEIESQYKKITCDEVKIKQILSNLISNSIKFTTEGVIKLKVSCKKDKLILNIKDTGVGMSEDFLKVICTPFTQADSSTTRKYGGSGLGLSIITSFIKLLKGTIDIKSAINDGTEITVEIPVSINKPVRRIVIIEDNYANRFILKEIITNISDYVVDVYENGKEYLDSIKDKTEENREPLLIFLDLHMPFMDGHSCCIELRKKGYSCPIIAVSANGMKSERIKCIESGIDDFVLKPITIEDIDGVLKKFKVV
jgi:PAS domain S-box-containing protein